MLPSHPIPRAILSSLRWLAGCALVVSLSACCGAEEWSSHTFEQGNVRFEVPGSWQVQVRKAGEAATAQPASDPGSPAPPKVSAGVEHGKSAILTALPVLEDAALVMIAPDRAVAPGVFARSLTTLIPLNKVAFTAENIPWSVNELRGFAFEGKGLLPNDGTPVYFRSVVMDVTGEPVIITLFAEESEREHYEVVFDRILTSLNALGAPTPQPKAAPVADATPAPEARPPGAIPRDPPTPATPDAAPPYPAPDPNAPAPDGDDAATPEDAAAADPAAETPDGGATTPPSAPPEAAEGDAAPDAKAPDAKAPDAKAPEDKATEDKAPAKPDAPGAAGEGTPSPDAGAKAPPADSATGAERAPPAPSPDATPKAATPGAPAERATDAPKAPAAPVPATP